MAIQEVYRLPFAKRSRRSYNARYSYEFVTIVEEGHVLLLRFSSPAVKIHLCTGVRALVLSLMVPEGCWTLANPARAGKGGGGEFHRFATVYRWSPRGGITVAGPFKSFPTWLIKLSEVLSESAAAPRAIIADTSHRGHVPWHFAPVKFADSVLRRVKW